MIERIAELSPDPADPAGSYLIGTAATATWAYDLAAGFLELAVTGLRRQGRRGLLAQALVSQAWAAVHLANAPVAKSAATEADRLSRETGQVRWAVAAQLALAAIAGEEGDGDAAEALTGEAEAKLHALGTNPMQAMAQFVRGRAAVAHQRYPYGAEQLRRVLDPADPAYHPYIGAWGLADLIEAEAHADTPDAARAHLARLESLAAVTSAPLLRAQAAYARPMVAPDDRAEPLYQAALAHDLADWPQLRGRMQLWYGRWLRRQRRIADSRGPLRAAHDTFSSLRFGALADCARQELRASGVTNRRHEPTDGNPADPAGTRDRQAGGRRPVQPGDRPAAVYLAPDGRLPPAPDLPQARHHLAESTARDRGQVRRHRRHRLAIELQVRPQRVPARVRVGAHPDRDTGPVVLDLVGSVVGGQQAAAAEVRLQLAERVDHEHGPVGGQARPPHPVGVVP